MTTWRLFLLLSITAFAIGSLQARSFEYTPGSHHQIIGRIHVVQTGKNDTLESIAHTYDMGYDELLHANGSLLYRPLVPGTLLTLPTQYILPQAPHKGIVVNLAEKRLYYFTKTNVITYPVGIGRQGWATPVGKVFIADKHTNPSWYVPKSVREAQAEAGNTLPAVVPPGPNNPLGQYALRLSKSNYLIHGTNDPDGVGKRSSAGCLRMYPDDIKDLYRRVAIHTPVLIVNQPIKIGQLKSHWLLESHTPLEEAAHDRNRIDGAPAHTDISLDKMHRALMQQLTAKNIMTEDYWVEFILQESSGIPTPLPTTQTPHQPPQVIPLL